MHKRSLIILSVFSMYYAFLYMNPLIFALFILSSAALLYLEREYLYTVINRYITSIYLLFVFSIVLSMPFIVLDNYSTPVYLLLTLWSILLAIVFLKEDNILFLYDGVKYLLYTFIAFTLAYLYATHGKYPQGYHLEYMISNNVSANGVTSFLNIILGLFTALSFKLKRETTFTVSFLVLYITIEGYGRGSIIFALMLLAINLFFLYVHAKPVHKLLIIVSVVLTVLIISPFVYDIYMSTKLASGLQSPRAMIFKEYMEKIDVYSLFFGASYEGTIIAETYHNNPHITYIRTHHIFGLFYLLGLLYLIGQQIVYLFRKGDSTDWMILLIVLAILIRNVTEPLFFPSLFDSLFLVVLFLISKQYNYHTKGNIT